MLKSDARPEATKELRNDSSGSPVESTRTTSVGMSSRQWSRSLRFATLPAIATLRETRRFSRPDRARGEAATMKTEITPRRNSSSSADCQAAPRRGEFADNRRAEIRGARRAGHFLEARARDLRGI